MSNIAPNLSYHYWYLGVRGIELEEEADPLVLVRGSEFNHEREIEMVPINEKPNWVYPDEVKFNLNNTKIDGELYRYFTITDYCLQ